MLNPADAPFLESLAARLPPGTLRDAEDRHRQEPRGIARGSGRALALPRRVEEVSAILRACTEARVGVIPYGGGTGLVGGQVAGEGAEALILSLERMASVREVLPAEDVMVAEAGVILADARAAAAAAGRLFPLSLASEGSARLGGLLATNAGGTGVLRYGNARDLTLGIEAVLPSGEILAGPNRLRKNNTGYDLRHLLVGAEGTLGVITAAALRLFHPPAGEAAAMLAVPGPAEALALLSLARDRLGEAVSAFELISGVGLGFLARALPRPAPAARRAAGMVRAGGGRGAGGGGRRRGAGGAGGGGLGAGVGSRWGGGAVGGAAGRVLGGARDDARRPTG